MIDNLSFQTALSCEKKRVNLGLISIIIDRQKFCRLVTKSTHKPRTERTLSKISPFLAGNVKFAKLVEYWEML